MSLTSLNDIASGLAASDRQTCVINKATVANQTSGKFCSLWRATGTPSAATIPTAVETCNKSTTGGWNFVSPTSGKSLYIAAAKLVQNTGGTSMEIHDRLVQMGGLSGVLTTSQTVNLVVTDTSSNLQTRLGAATLVDLNWWLECYTDMGSTAVNATVGVTYTDTTTGTSVIALPATPRAGTSYLIIPASGKVIKSVDSVTLSATTGTAGNFGFTCTRELTAIETTLGNLMRKYNWAETEITEILDNACICFFTLCNTTGSGALLGQLRVIHK